MPTLDRDAAPSSARLTYLVKRLELAIRSRLDSITAEVGLTTSQYAALSVLKSRKGISSAALARRSFVSPQAMNEMVAALERKGFVIREQSPDHARVLRLFISDEGERVLNACESSVDEVEATMVAMLSRSQIAALPEVLDHCYRALVSNESAGSDAARR